VAYNAFLPELAPPGAVGRLSGRGWAFGYVGGLACLGVGLGMVGVGDFAPWVTAAGHWNVRATNLLVAAWFVVFALPMFVLVRDGPRPAAVPPWSLRAVLGTLKTLPRRPTLLRFLVAHLVYNDALMALITLAGLYMNGTLGMSTGEILAMGIGLNVVAGLGALLFGHVDDRMGPRTAVLASLVLLGAGCALAIAVPTVPAFAVAAALVGLGMGPNQAASRSLLAQLVEPGRYAEYFGLFSLSGKATVWMGPLLYSLVAEWTGSQRAAFLPLLAMLVVGFALMWSVRAPARAATP
jgi:UMF1 family MFS transporter